MRIEIQMSCEGCNDPSKVLACDSTYIGIGFRNTYATPIETPAKHVPVNSNDRRLDCCFLSCETKDPETKRLYTRSYLSFVCNCISQRFVVEFINFVSTVRDCLCISNNQ